MTGTLVQRAAGVGGCQVVNVSVELGHTSNNGFGVCLVGLLPTLVRGHQQERT